jgi:DNA polymerase-3 subunit beta
VRITITHGALSAALDIAARACGKSANVPALGYVLLDASTDGGLSVTGTDLRVRAHRTAEALVEQAGAVCLPPKALIDFLDAVAPDAPISLSVDAGHKAVLQSGRTTARVAGLDPEHFPMGAADAEPAWTLNLYADVLRGLIESTAYAAAQDETRPALAGVAIEATADSLTFLAADGMRLARRTIELSGADSLAVNCPARALLTAAAGLKEAGGDARLSVDAAGRALTIDADTGTWALALLEERFPDISRQLAQEEQATVTVQRSELQRACRLVDSVLVSIIGTDGKSVSKVAKAVLEFGPDSVTVRAGDSSADHEAVTVIDAAVSGTPEPIGLNSGALRDAAESLTGAGGISIELCGPGRSVFLRNASESRREQVALIQPLAITNRGQR